MSNDDDSTDDPSEDDESISSNTSKAKPTKTGQDKKLGKYTPPSKEWIEKKQAKILRFIKVRDKIDQQFESAYPGVFSPSNPNLKKRKKTTTVQEDVPKKYKK